MKWSRKRKLGIVSGVIVNHRRKSDNEDRIIVREIDKEYKIFLREIYEHN